MPYRPPKHRPFIVETVHTQSIHNIKRRFYRTPAWRDLRAAVLERDHYRCQLVLFGCQGTATIVDHIVEREQGGADDITNLRAVCQACHNRRHLARDLVDPGPYRA